MDVISELFGGNKMLLTAGAAGNMAAIVLADTRGQDQLVSQSPLHVVDLDKNWLVKGNPVDDEYLDIDNCVFYIMFDKSSAEVVLLTFEGSMELTDQEIRAKSPYLSEEEVRAVVEPRTEFLPHDRSLQANLDLNAVLYGGLINTKRSAIDYAYNLLQSTSDLKLVPRISLSAADRSEIWHISTTIDATETSTEILSFSRRNGQVLSGDI